MSFYFKTVLSVLLALPLAAQPSGGPQRRSGAMQPGTAAAPGLPFSNDTDTGLFGNGSDILGLATGGSERLRVTATGEVSINDSTPDDDTTLVLTSTSTTAAHDTLRVNNNAGTSVFVVEQQGFVGIGIANPTGNLDVSAGAARTGTHATSPSVYFTGNLADGTAGGAAGNIELRHANATQGIGFGYNTMYAGGSNTNQALNLLSKGTSALTLNAYSYSTGNVGIGTTSPGALLDVAGTIRGNNTITSTRTTDLGWSVVNVANQACNTTCTNACVFGMDTAALGNFLPCTDGTADTCICAGAN